MARRRFWSWDLDLSIRVVGAACVLTTLAIFIWSDRHVSTPVKVLTSVGAAVGAVLLLWLTVHMTRKWWRTFRDGEG